MTIKEVEEKLNISRANIRFYEKEGLLEPKRNDNEYRNYSEDDVKRLEKIILFRKCNVSIENIRLIFSGVKSIEEIFKEQLSVIENEVQQLEGAKLLCEKLVQEKSSVDKIDAEKYINMIENEEQKGKKFYDIADDYIFANEKLYQSIIENKNFKGGEKMKKGVKVLIDVASLVLMFLLMVLFDSLLFKKIDWIADIIFTAIFAIAGVIATKIIEKKNDGKITRKQKINQIVITIVVAIVALFGYYFVQETKNISQEPNSNVLEMSVKKSLMDIANDEYDNNNSYYYAECHKILGYEVKDEKIFVYVVAEYGLFTENQNEIDTVDAKQATLTIVYKYSKNAEGTYDLIEYNESIPENMKNAANVDFTDEYFESQLNNYLQK